METIVYGCSRCGFMTFWLFAFNSHLKKCRKLERQFSCGDNLEAHICQKCDFETLLTVEYKDHINSKDHGVNSGYKTSKNNDIKQKEYEEFSCELCNFKTFSKYFSELHKLKVHCTAKVVKNKEINESVLSKCGLKIQAFHENSDFMNAESLFQCPHCSHRTKYKHHLKAHIKNVHTNSDQIEWLKCEQCFYQAKTNFNLKRHKMHRHTDSSKIEWYKCEQCSYQTKVKKDLKRHIMYRHSDPNQIKWFKCKHCFHQTKTKGDLKRHVMRRHTDPNKSVWDLRSHKICKHTDPIKIK